MRKKTFIPLLSFALSSLFITAQRNPNNSLNGNGLKFTPNKGQVADINGKLCPDVLYKGESGADIYLRKTGISYVYSNMDEVMHNVHEKVEGLIKAGSITEVEEHKKEEELILNEKIKLHRVDMDFEGCNTDITTTNEDEVEGYQNFYSAHCPQGITNVRQYNKVTCKNIYNNIDISYYGDKRNGLKYDLIVHPHSDPNQIKLHWKGAESIHINREGNLVIKTSVNEFTESIPKVYQIINGNIIDVKAEYVLTPIANGEVLINFSFLIYNSSFPLVVDPWATYYGGNSYDTGLGIATDNSGNVVFTGSTSSTNFPVTAGAFQGAGGGFGTYDAFVVKFNSAGIRQWATYYGGNTGSELAMGITTDNTGNVIITGHTNPSLPLGATAGNSIQQPVFGGLNYDAFVVKFDNAGVRQWATYYGGSSDDRGYGIATDNAGSVIITGWTQSVGFPVLSGFQMSKGGGTDDAFVVKFNSNGTLNWSTFYGGSLGDEGVGITTDKANNILISGKTQSTDFPVTAGSPQTTYGGGTGLYAVGDAFVVKFNPAGTRLWATFYGGSLGDEGLGITTDNADNVIFTGQTLSTNLTITAGAFQTAYGGATAGFAIGDAFLVKLSPAGTILWATLYGGSLSDWGSSVITDGNNNIFLCMETEDSNPPMPADACSYQPVFGGVEDQLIVKFSPAGKKLCATYLGGTTEDDVDYNAGHLAYFGNSIYITGVTKGGGYPVTAGAFQTLFGGSSDIFVASLCANICEGKVLTLNYTANTTSVCANAPVTFTPSVTNSCDTTGYKYHWTFTGGNPASSDSVKPTVAFSGVGTHDVKLILTTICKKDSITKPNYITINSCACLLTANTTTTPANCGNPNGTAIVNQSGGGGSYSYLWNNGQTSQSATGLVAGNYTVTVTDAGSCTATAVASITSPMPLSGQFTKGTANCAQCGCKEWLMVTAAGGTSPYTYTWPDGYVNRYKNQLCPGSYSINIKDKNGCSVNVNLTAP